MNLWFFVINTKIGTNKTGRCFVREEKKFENLLGKLKNKNFYSI